MVIVVVGIMSAYAVVKSTSPGEITLASQAQTMANDIRRAQTLAYTHGQRVLITISTGENGSYGVTCVPATPPCSGAFTGGLTNKVWLSGSNLYFNSLGQPMADATTLNPLNVDTSYTLCYPSCGSGQTTETVTVAALTGNVTVSP